MSGFEKFLLTLGVIFAVAIFGTYLQNKLAKKRVANWFGSGVHEGLAPYQAALILGIHPSAIVAILLEELRLRGRARAFAKPHEPCRVEWTRGDPGNRVEQALFDAMEEDGTLRPEGVIELLETIYEEVNHEMIPHSGRATAVHYRELAESLWGEDLAALVEMPGSFPFFLLHDPERAWGRLGDDPVSERFKESFRVRERFRSHLVPDTVYAERARRARSGFFRYRRELKLGPRLTGEEARHWGKLDQR